MDLLDDAELLRRYAEYHSEAAFGELVRRHLNLVYRAALRQTQGDTHRAEDISQAVFTELARQAGSLARHPRLTGWLYTTTHYVTSATLRKERRQRNREQEVYAMSDRSYDPDPGDGVDRVRPVLDEVLRDLSSVDREAVLLHFFEQRPFADVGARLRLREDAARMRVGRALEKLRSALVRRGIESTATALALMLSTEATEAAPVGLAGAITQAAVVCPAVGVGTAVAFFELMSTTKMTLSIAAVIGAAAVGFAIYQFNAARDIEAALRDSKRAVPSRRIPSSRPSPRALRPISGPIEDQREAFRRFLADVPQARGILLANFQSSAATVYGPFIRSVGMSPEEIADFETVYANARLDGLTLTTQGLSDPGFGPPPRALQTVLGSERFQQLESFQQVQLAYGFANLAAASAGLAGAPLSADQVDQLVQVMVKNVDAAQSGGPFALTAVDWGAALPQLQAAVRPAQWNAIEADFLRLRLRQATQTAPAPTAQ